MEMLRQFIKVIVSFPNDALILGARLYRTLHAFVNPSM